MRRQTNLSFVPKNREPMVFTLWVHLSTRTVRPGKLRESQDGEVELPRFRRPEGLENWEYLTRQAGLLTAAAQEGEAA